MESYVICPFFKYNTMDTIACEGLLMKFGKATSRKEFEKSVCSTYEYKDSCPYAKILHKKYEEEK